MRTTHVITTLAAMTILSAFSGEAFARNRVYHPGLGRFMQRDPVGTPLMQSASHRVTVTPSVSSQEFTERDPAGMTISGATHFPAIASQNSANVVISSGSGYVTVQFHGVGAEQLASTLETAIDQFGVDAVRSNPSLMQYADGPNLYQYVGSNPISHLDPLGLAKLLTKGAGSGITQVPHSAVVVDVTVDGQKKRLVLSWEGNGWEIYDYSSYISGNKSRDIWESEIRGLDDQKIYCAVKNDTRHDYHLTVNNCAQNALDALKQGGSFTGDSVKQTHPMLLRKQIKAIHGEVQTNKATGGGGGGKKASGLVLIGLSIMILAYWLYLNRKGSLAHAKKS